MSTTKVFKQFFFIDEASWTVRLMWSLNTNAQFCIIKVDTIQFKEANEHMTKIGVFNSISNTICCTTAATTTDAIIKMIVIEVTVIVTATVIIIR